MAPPRMTLTTQLVLQVFLDSPDTDRFGAEIAAVAGLRSGTLYPILARLEGVGWIASRWEEVDVKAAGRPARRYYRLTSDGVGPASAALAGARRPHLQLRPLGGEA